MKKKVVTADIKIIKIVIDPDIRIKSNKPISYIILGPSENL